MISDEEILRRRDMRDTLTFTIDPVDAKDFDDALSYVSLGNGEYQVGVHIADVTHYVRPGQEVDSTAYERATSVYLVDRVLPMLPEELCNDLCSLRPMEDKLCMSVIFTLTADARIIKHKVCRTIIRSNFRLTYEQAQAILTSSSLDAPLQGESTEPTEELQQALKQLNLMGKVLRQRRIANGALELEQPEPRFTLDEHGHPIAITFHVSTDANHLIEEFMLLANRTIAEQMGRTGKPMVFRVHDRPDPEKMASLEKFSRRMGERIQPATLDLLTVRAMAKAVYSTFNIGHYGLAFDYYTHFTSPIRRYPDMMVHRIVATYLLGERHGALPDDLEAACDHCSEMEQLATQAERESIKEMQALWISDHVGEIFDGYISGVTEFGLFVTLTDSHCDGLVPIRTICPGQYLDFDEKNYCLRTRSDLPGKTRRRKHYIGYDTDEQPKAESVFTLGDTIRVKVVKADLERNLIEFQLP